MWQLSRPTPERVQAFRDAQRSLPLSYRGIGATRDGGPTPPATTRPRRHCRGQAASPPRSDPCVADVPLPLATMSPPASDRRRRVAAVVVRVRRVVPERRADRRHREPRRFTAYGTAGHAERGGRFVSGSPTAPFRCAVVAAYWAARLAYPLARHLQRRFARMSKAAMARAVAQSSAR
jgi:hypothetical protein